MPKRDTEYEHFKETCGGWFNYHGNIGLRAGDVAMATLFDEAELVQIVLTKPYTFNRWWCKIVGFNSDGIEYLVDRTIIFQILIDKDYNLRRKRRKNS